MQDPCSQMNPSRPCFFPSLLLRTFCFSQIKLFNISQVYPTSTFPNGICTPQTDTEYLVSSSYFLPLPECRLPFSLASDPSSPFFMWGNKLNLVPAAAPVPYSSARDIYLSSHSAPPNLIIFLSSSLWAAGGSLPKSSNTQSTVPTHKICPCKKSKAWKKCLNLVKNRLGSTEKNLLNSLCLCAGLISATATLLRAKHHSHKTQFVLWIRRCLQKGSPV